MFKSSRTHLHFVVSSGSVSPSGLETGSTSGVAERGKWLPQAQRTCHFGGDSAGFKISDCVTLVSGIKDKTGWTF